jgi:hypothetical protein
MSVVPEVTLKFRCHICAECVWMVSSGNVAHPVQNAITNAMHKLEKHCGWYFFGGRSYCMPCHQKVEGTLT